jgi:aspartate/tyrosine/aromatic aminotransferase
MGLYGERVGAIHFVASDKDTAEKVNIKNINKLDIK